MSPHSRSGGETYCKMVIEVCCFIRSIFDLYYTSVFTVLYVYMYTHSSLPYLSKFQASEDLVDFGTQSGSLNPGFYGS